MFLLTAPNLWWSVGNSMSTHTSQLFSTSPGSRWLTNQAVSSAGMVDKMAREDLRRGHFSEMDVRVARIEEMVNEHELEAEHERELEWSGLPGPVLQMELCLRVVFKD